MRIAHTASRFVLEQWGFVPTIVIVIGIYTHTFAVSRLSLAANSIGTDFAPSDALDTIRPLKIDAIGRSMPTLGVFAAILDKDGRILCVRMNYAAHAWTTPGGRVELGESPLDALKREVLEESGLDVVVGELVGVYSKPYKDDIVLFFRARVVGRHPWQPNDEISEMGYFGRDELPMPMGIGATTRIVDALDGVSGVV
jgi:8-oxo-dGTP diphosphatase